VRKRDARRILVLKTRLLLSFLVCIVNLGGSI
jgi:hypothetical protein